MDELNRDPQQQDQGGGLVEMLSSLLSPQSAEAASAPNPQTQLFQALQFANHLKQQQQMQQQQAQTAQQRAIIVPLQQQLLQQRVVAGTEKAKPKPSIAELLGSPQQVGNSGASQVPMFRGITPNTGTPYFGNVMPDWSTPEAKAQFEQASQRLNPPSAAAEVKGKLTPEKTQLLGTLAEHLKSVPEAQRMIALRNLIPELDVQEKQVLQDKLGIKQIEVQQAKDIAKSTAVAPKGLYLDKSGVPYSPMYGGDVTSGTTYYQQGGAQQQVFEAAGMINTHVDETLNQLQAISKLDRNRFSQYLNTELKRFRGDSNITALTDLLGPATAMAVARAYAAGGGRMQGGVRLAEMFKNGVYSEGDTLKTSLEKLRTLESINLQNAQGHNLHPEVVKAVKDRIETINQFIGAPKKAGVSEKQTAAGGAPMQALSKSGKPIISNDGGKTWEYK